VSEIWWTIKRTDQVGLGALILCAAVCERRASPVLSGDPRDNLVLSQSQDRLPQRTTTGYTFASAVSIGPCVSS